MFSDGVFTVYGRFIFIRHTDPDLCSSSVNLVNILQNDESNICDDVSTNTILKSDAKTS